MKMKATTNNLDDLKELARLSIKQELTDLRSKGFEISDQFSKNLGLEVRFDSDFRIFSLVSASENPLDSIVVASIKANINTFEIGTVYINLDCFLQTEQIDNNSCDS